MANISQSMQRPKLRPSAQNELSRTQDFQVIEIKYNDFRPRNIVKKYLICVLTLCFLAHFILISSVYLLYLIKAPQLQEHIFGIYLTIILLPSIFLIFLAAVPTAFSQDLPLHTDYAQGDLNV